MRSDDWSSDLCSSDLVEAKTHEKIATGKAENKFGISWKRAPAVYARAAALPGIAATGIDVHIGSQLTSLDPFEAAFRRVATMVVELRAQGHEITQIDLGGGLGIPYKGDNDIPPHPDDYAALVKRTVGHLGRSEAGRVGKWWVRKCRSRWSPYYENKKKTQK